MKMLKKFAYILAVATAAFGFTACTEDVEYTPAEPVSADCQQVYFSASNLTVAEYDNTIDYNTIVIPVKVCRTYVAGAVSVPMVVKQNGSAFNAPEVVEFADGQAEASFDITLNTNDLGKYEISFEIVDPLYADPYTIIEGGKNIYSIAVEFVKWNKVCDAKVVDDYFEFPRPTMLEQKEGTSLYRLNSLYAPDCHFYFNVSGESYTIPEDYVLGMVTVSGVGCYVFDTGMRSGDVSIWGAVDVDPGYSFFIEGEGMNISLVYLTSTMQIIGGKWFDVTVQFE